MPDLLHLMFTYPLPMLVSGLAVYVVTKFRSEQVRIKLTEERNEFRYKFECSEKKVEYVTSQLISLQKEYAKIENAISSGYTLTHKDVFKGGKMVLMCHYSVLEWAKKMKTTPLLAMCRLVEQYFYNHDSASIEQDHKNCMHSKRNHNYLIFNE